MKNFKRIAVATLSLAFLMVSSPVYAVNLNNQVCQKASGSTLCTDTGGTSNPIVGPNGVLTHATSLFAIVVGIAAVIMIIISGMRFVLANGDAGGVSKAKQALIYAIVGVVVALLAQGIVGLVLSKL